ncbi:MAG: hypothetical protein JJU02_03800 [Cryomorphaceae bacterium]|nr:hypothetical protein [Cryomorphaceae bacterium]
MTRLSLSVILIGLLTACGQTNKEKSEAKNKGLNLDGYWILTNYIDKILETKSIAPQSSQRLTWDVIVFKFENDTIKTHGLIMESKYPASQKIESLTLIKGMAGSYNLVYNDLDRTIVANDIEGNDTINYIFRKIHKHEEKLVADIDGKAFFQQLEHNLYHLFINQIISGTYHPIVNYNNVNTIELLTDGTTSGFKNYNKYSIHDFFGTLHPFSDDAIMFEDSTKEVSGLGPPDYVEYYKWEFKQDTLILTKYETKDHERFTVGHKQYKLVKQNKNRH